MIGHIMKRIIMMLTCLGFTVSTLAQQHEGITVIGKATIKQIPDEFNVSFTIEQRGRLVSKIKANVDQKVDMLISAIESMQIPNQNIRATHLQIFPLYSHRNNHIDQAFISNQRDTIISVKPELNKNSMAELEFSVVRNVTVKLNHVDDYEKLLEKAIKIGVNRITPVQMGIANAEKLYKRAMLEALDNAKEKATQVAKRLNITLGDVKNMNEQTYRVPSTMLMSADAMESTRSSSSYIGVEQITAEVLVTFAIKQ